MEIERAVDIVLTQNFLPLSEVYNLLSASRSFRRKLTANVVKATLSKHPLRGRFRFNWWVLHLLQSSKGSPKLQNLYTGDCLYHYLSLIQQLGVARASTNSPGQIGEVMRDVKRTFPMHPFFLDGMPGQDMLARILQAEIISQPDVGYCQGMNFVVGSFILSHPICSECPERVMQTHVAEARPTVPAGSGKPSSAKFWAPAMHFNMFNLADAESEIYVALMCLLDGNGQFKMQSTWRSGMPVMRLYNYQFDRLLKWNLPQLHSHFISIGFSPEILLSQWFLTFFIYTFPLELCFDMWDYVMPYGWPSIFSFALGFCGIMETRILDMDLEELSNEMRKWKCDKFELPSEVTFNDIVSLSLSINVSESELTALEDAFASKLVADAAMSTNTTVQPHLGVRDLAQLSKSIGRYLTKNTHFNNSFSVVSSRVAGLGLMSPFSHSGFLDTPIEDFNSVANFNEKTQKDLSAVFIELVELNKQVESDKEVYLFKIVSTSQKLDSLKNELDVLTTKEFVAKDFYALIKSELSAAMESETVGSISGSIHNSQALGLGSFHGHSSHGINSSVHSSRDSMLLTAPYKDIEIQTHASLDSSESPVRNARKTSPRVVDLPRIHLGSHDQGILGIVAYTKVRTPKQQSELEIRHRNSEDRKNIDSSLRRNEKHGNKISASPSRHSIDNESTSPIRPQSVMSTQLTSPEGSEDSYQPRTRRYIRGRPSPAKNTVRQTSFEDIDLGDPGDAYYTTMDSSSTSKEVHVDAFHKSGASAAHNGGSSWSFFSRKTAPPPVVAGGLLQAVKTGRRAAHIMELDIHHDVSVESSSIPNVENSESERSVITLSEPASKLTENSNLHVNALHSTVNSENSILQMMSASTTKFIPDPTLHQDGGALVTVLGIATSWATGSKKDAATLKSELIATESNIKELAERIMEINTCIEEETEKKDRLCEQLQLLMEEMYKKRTYILRSVINNYVMA